MIPNVYVIGVTKCATTSLYEALKEHNVSLKITKENTYFLKDYHLGKEHLSCFYPTESDICVDFHPNNCLVDYVPHRIQETAGSDVKIVMLIREPIARAYSEICHFNTMRPGREYRPDLAAAFNLEDINSSAYYTEYEYVKQADPRGGFYDRRYIERGFYLDHIRRYSMFKNMEVFIFEKLIGESNDERDRLAKFIGVPYLNLKKTNSKSDGGNFSEITYDQLKKIYRLENDELSSVLNINLNQFWKY